MDYAFRVVLLPEYLFALDCVGSAWSFICSSPPQVNG